MFLNKYLDDFYLEMVINNYEESYLNTLEEEHFLKIYNLFKEEDFYFINDIILNYLEIFSLDYNVVKKALESLKNQLGDNYVFTIGDDITYLDKVLEDD